MKLTIQLNSAKLLYFLDQICNFYALWKLESPNIVSKSLFNWWKHISICLGLAAMERRPKEVWMVSNCIIWWQTNKKTRPHRENLVIHTVLPMRSKTNSVGHHIMQFEYTNHT